MRKALLILAFVQLSFSQATHYLPFASSGNTLELTIANSSSVGTSNVSVEVANLPGWLQFSETQQRFDHLGPGEEAAAVFTFSIEKSAPVNVVQTLRFVITNSAGESWTKEISLSISPPEKFELFQNYPNPFNPSTAISYQLSADSKVSLRIYDLLGREVATLVDQDKPAGYHQETWNAAPYSSGMYIYQLTYLPVRQAGTDLQGNRQFHRKTMLLVK
jgi:hypothetical protein